MTLTSPSIVPRPVITVQGPIPYDQLGITDAHNHVWIETIPGACEGIPVLNQYNLILSELIEYRQKDGRTLLDCQPGGCGRDGNKLLGLSKASQVNIIACTGFHRKKYYPPDYWLWEASAQNVADTFSSELIQGLNETLHSPISVKAGFIKIALEAIWADCAQAAMEGAASVAGNTKALLQIHTEKGSLAEKACIYFTDRGVLPNQLVLCHMDKRPDISLHKALANLGVLLEYDTFYRPKYNPTSNLWPLIDQMVGAGLSDRIALATDMAEAVLYHNIGGGPGLSSLPGEIQQKLTEIGFPETVREQILGGNIARRLAGIN
jgi:predicted metal-dependent phosphotriesterase family hydrolase